MKSRTASRAPGKAGLVPRAISRLPLAAALIVAGSAVCVVYNMVSHRGILHSSPKVHSKKSHSAPGKRGATAKAKSAEAPFPVSASTVVLVKNAAGQEGGSQARETGPAELRVIALHEATRYLSSGEAIFVDARSRQRWEMGHIPGAIDIHSSDFDRGFAAAEPRLPRDATIVVYCESEHCDQAEEVIRRLQEKGYKRLLHFKQGWIYWEFSDQRQEKSGEWAK